ncbi:homocysteine S-methyltransferase [Desulfosarcina alkanivorans]|uniref:Homocysteine S-methyltransferase n=1 Tax=Desulfosarcina alkanivorans TaxID=571177 RepID=A0A5K7YP01_9BACT|nr:homocysteine S-methyltransferase family protein [Desulfosarcina alkanivorans]BBO70936.1 homocysteine S-methyltransferase [Desulfosarcina alkanivorans]
MEIIEKVKQEGILLDGGMGSMLIARGLKGGDCAEKWNVDRPEVIREIHQAYFDAGADVATANTFGASSLKLEKMGIKESIETINTEAVKHARAASKPGQYVAGDLGHVGEMFSPMGRMTAEKAKDIYVHHAGIIEAAGVDLFLIETIFDLNEAIVALEAVQAVSSKPVFCSLTFNQAPKGFFTLMGNPVEASMKQLRDAGAAAVGANCSLGSESMIGLAGQIRESVDIPVIVQPNAGMPQTRPDGTAFYPEDEILFAENIKKIKALGVEIVGGCCGTTPAFIQKIRASF